MKTEAPKSKQGHNPSEKVPELNSDSSFEFKDKRSLTVSQRTLQAMANNSSRVQKAAEWQSQANQYVQRLVQKKEAPIQALIDSATFQGQTPGSMLRPRRSVRTIDADLDNYHAANQNNKLRMLATLKATINLYIASKPADPSDARLTAVNTLKANLLLEEPSVRRLDILAQNNVPADLTNIVTAAGISDLDLGNLSALAPINAINQIVALNAQGRTNANIITLFNDVAQVNNYQQLRQLSASPLSNADILLLADLGGAGLGGHILPAQPTFDELRALATSGKTIVNYTTLLGMGVVQSVAELEELGRTNRVQRAINELSASGAHDRMYYIPMNLHYKTPEAQQDRTGWAAAYNSVYAISGAAGKLQAAASSNTILQLLIAHGTLNAGTAAVPNFLVQELRARWMSTHTGAEGVHYQGGDRGDDFRA